MDDPVMECAISFDANGAISCKAWKTNGVEVSHNDLVSLVGVLETVKLAMLNGRWGIMDSKDAENWRVMDGFGNQYIEAFNRIRGERAEAVERGKADK